MRGFMKSKKKHMLKISTIYLIGKAEIPIHYTIWATSWKSSFDFRSRYVRRFHCLDFLKVPIFVGFWTNLKMCWLSFYGQIISKKLSLSSWEIKKKSLREKELLIFYLMNLTNARRGAMRLKSQLVFNWEFTGYV